MELGISTYSLPWAVGVPGQMPEAPLTALGLLQLAQEYGISHVQYGDNLPLHTLSAQELATLNRFAAANAQHIEVGTRGLLHNNICKYLEIARLLNAPFLRVVIDSEGFRPSVPEVINIIRSLLPVISNSGVRLSIENHDRFPALQLEHIIRQTDIEWIGICLDTANSIGAGEGIATVLQVLAPYTLNLHIKDIIIERLSHKMGFVVNGCAAGKGVLDIPAIIRKLNEYGRCHSATLEVWSNFITDLPTTIGREKEWFNQSINYLKNIRL